MNKHQRNEDFLWLIAMVVAIVGATTIIVCIVSVALSLAELLER